MYTTALQYAGNMVDSTEGTKDEVSIEGNSNNTRPQDKSSITPEKGALGIPLGLHVDDLHGSNAPLLFKYIPDPQQSLETAYQNILSNLYHAPTQNGQPTFTPILPETKSVSLVIANFEGAAYTTDVGDGNKKLCVSSAYIGRCARLDDPAHELRGVLTHELVHCFQHSHPPGLGSLRPPGGLIEGIADFIRLRAGLGARHWKLPSTSTDAPPRWDAGYENTAYLLNWLENTEGKGLVGLINHRLYTNGYGDNGADFWVPLLGKGIEQAYVEYCQHLDSPNSAANPQADNPTFPN